MRWTYLLGVALLATVAAELSAQSAVPSVPRSTGALRGPAGEPLVQLTALDLRWALPFDTLTTAMPGFDQQSAYLPLAGGGLRAIDLDTGREQWTVTAPTMWSPATGDGFVFIAGDARVGALEQTSGKTAWDTPLPAGLAAGPQWDAGLLLLSTAAGDLVALSPGNGQQLWRISLGSPLAAPTTASDDLLFAALADGRIVAVAVSDGTLRWSRALNEPVAGMLALREQLLVGTRANRLHSVSVDRGRERWQQRVGADAMGAPVADERFIYFVARDNVLRAFDRRNGNLRWTRPLPARPASGAFLVDHLVIVPFASSDIGAYLATTGQEIFTARALGELATAPFVRDTGRMTSPRLIATIRGGALQAFAARVEPPVQALAELPGVRAGS